MIMYQVSYINKIGLRVLFGAAQGRRMCKTREDAENFLSQLMVNTGEDRLLDICGKQAKGTFRVDGFECYPDHGDPVGIYVDE